MATHTGSAGTIKIGANAVAELRSFSIEETADTVEDTVMTDTARSFKPTLTSFSGSADVYWDETDTAQTALSVGAEVTIGFYPEGDTSTSTYYSGSCIVTGVSRSSSFDGLVEASISLQGNGALTTSVVA
mgnify:FL=1|jgi:predicted secreted protein|tara:strand:- start:1328 stop:1717 length:390 start_codon:yes stop_codon:yes gene_type:complete